MKIKYIYAHEAGPIGADWSVDLINDWDDQIYQMVLFSGANGSGKSTLLRMIAKLWDATGHWLDKRDSLPPTHSTRDWLNRWGGVALLLEDVLPDLANTIGLVFGEDEWVSTLQTKHPEVVWVGETFVNLKNSKRKKKLLLPNEESWLEKWAQAQKKLILTSEKMAAPNLVYLDAEERRWVSPRKRIGETLPDNLRLRWLTTYQVSEDWEGQLESSLINLKIVDTQKYKSVIQDLNSFLFDKEIEPEIRTEDRNRLRVKVNRHPEEWHYLDDLSAGEHQVLIMLYMISRWLEPGGIVLIDEPDLHLHPSLQLSLLSRLESIIRRKEGQLLITSHVPVVWERYKTLGKRILLGDPNESMG